MSAPRWILSGTALLAAVGLACSDRPAPSSNLIQAVEADGMPPSRQQLLLSAAMVALPPAGVTAADLPDPGSRGAQIVTSYCVQCHDLPTPAMHSAADWPSIVRRMWLRMERLPDSLALEVPGVGDRVTMLDYLNANALKVSGANLPPGRGREEFSMLCSRCHALPDPWIHSHQDWPTVFMRMERNMERMHVRPPTPQESTKILEYLQNIPPRT